MKAVEVFTDYEQKSKLDRGLEKGYSGSTLPAMRGEGPRYGREKSRKPKKAQRARKNPNEAKVRTRKAPEGKSHKKLSKAINSQRRFTKRIDQYLETLARPFASTGVKTPVNYNPVPSMMTTCSRTTVTGRTFANAGTTTELILFPGHAQSLDADAMDGFSYHCGGQAIGAIPTTFNMGPVTVSGVAPAAGVLNNSGVLMSAQVLTDVASSAALTYDVALPFSGIAGNGGHLRWKLVSMGIRVENTTPLATRGGFMSSVQITTPFSASTQAAYEIFPTYQITEKGNVGTLEISWIPRMDDIAFWHTESATTFNSPGWAAMRVWLNNDSVAAQNYSYQIVCNWELAGSHLAAVSTPAIHQPADKGVLEPTMDILRFGAPDSRDAPKVAQSVASTLSPFAEGAGKIVGTFASAGLKALMANVLG